MRKIHVPRYFLTTDASRQEVSCSLRGAWMSRERLKRHPIQDTPYGHFLSFTGSGYGCECSVNFVQESQPLEVIATLERAVETQSRVMMVPTGKPRIRSLWSFTETIDLTVSALRANGHSVDVRIEKLLF